MLSTFIFILARIVAKGEGGFQGPSVKERGVLEGWGPICEDEGGLWRVGVPSMKVREGPGRVGVPSVKMKGGPGKMGVQSVKVRVGPGRVGVPSLKVSGFQGGWGSVSPSRQKLVSCDADAVTQ